MAAHAQATFWYVLPSLPMFLLMPELLAARGGLPAGAGRGLRVLTVLLYLAMAWVGPRFGLKLRTRLPPQRS